MATTSSKTAHDEPKQVDLNNADQSSLESEEVPKEYISGFTLFLFMLSVGLNTALVGLELGIISTAIPGITDAFHRIQDVGWYGCATFLLVASTSSIWGKLYKYTPIKPMYLVGILLMLIGSIVSATATNSIAVIVGRAIQGVGIGGILNGSVILINLLTHPRLHPMLLGIWTAIFLLSTITGPLIGGAFTTAVTWRWCFWINLPLGGPVILLVLLFVRMPKHVKPYPASMKEILLQLDFPGFAFLLSSFICLALALQRGGQTEPWSSGTVIALLVLWVCLTIIFFVIEKFQGERAIVPLRLLKPRLTWTNTLFALFSSTANFQIIFYLPIYFQAVHNISAIMSGVLLLPYLGLFALGAVTSGALIGKTGYLRPVQLVSALLAVAGISLLYTLEVHSSTARYVGPQLLAGFALGLNNQIPMTAVQGLSEPRDMASSSGIVLSMQGLSGTYFLPIAQSIWANRLLYTLAHKYTGIDLGLALSTGSTELRKVFHGAELAAVLDAYTVGIKDVFAFSLASAALTVLISLIIPATRLPVHKDEEPKEIEVSDAEKGQAVASA